MNLSTAKKVPKEKQVSDLELLEILINKMIQKLQDNSYEPKMQDALKAIQLKHKLAPASEAEKIFWEAIEDIRSSELEKLYPSPEQNLKV